MDYHDAAFAYVIPEATRREMRDQDSCHVPDAFIDERLAVLRTPEGRQVVPMGVIPSYIYDFGWSERVTDRVVVIKERRRHYLEQHPDIVPAIHEPLLIRALHNPQEIHRNKIDESIALIYQSIPGDRLHYLRIALWLSDDPDLKNSVHSMRLARLKEILDGREAGRKVWP